MSRPLGSVERAVALLEALAAADGPLGTNEIARQTGINASTVSRALGTLLDAGLVEREQHGKWAYFSLTRDAAETLAAVTDLKGARSR